VNARHTRAAATGSLDFCKVHCKGSFRLRAAERNRQGKHAQPTAAITDSHTVKPTEESAHPSNYHAQKNVKGHKRHSLVDTLDRLVSVPSTQQTYRIEAGR
jgi:hypothetical protein